MLVIYVYLINLCIDLEGRDFFESAEFLKWNPPINELDNFILVTNMAVARESKQKRP